MRRRVGRVKINFDRLLEIAPKVLADLPLRVIGDNWNLTKHSGLYRRKDRSFTLVLIWRADCGATLRHTVRGIDL